MQAQPQRGSNPQSEPVTLAYGTQHGALMIIVRQAKHFL